MKDLTCEQLTKKIMSNTRPIFKSEKEKIAEAIENNKKKYGLKHGKGVRKK